MQCLYIDRFHRHAMKNKSKTIWWVTSRKCNLTEDKWRNVSKFLVCALSQTSHICQNVLHKFTEPSREPHILVYMYTIYSWWPNYIWCTCTPHYSWWPKYSVTIWNLISLVIQATEYLYYTYICINTFPATFTSQMAKNH